MNLPIHAIDAAIVVGYLVAILALGGWVGRGQKDTLEYLLGNRSLPTWAVLLSIVATETSAVTFLSVPGKAFVPGGDLRFLQLTFGYIIGRLLVVVLLLPLYFRGEPFTAYEVLQRRFGKLSRRASSLLFLCTRNLADALRLYLAALVLQAAIGLDLSLCIVVVGTVTIVYTYLGGVKSVVWNDCLQFVIYILGAFVVLYTILTRLPEGIEQFQAYAGDNDKLRVFDFDWSLLKANTFWGGLIGGGFLTMSTHGADQLTVQRLLAAKSQRAAGIALAASGVVVCFQFALFLTIGAALACFYDQFPPGTSLGENPGDRVMAHFIIHELRTPLVGFTLAAVFAAAFSSSLNSLSAALVNDLVEPLARHPMSGGAKMAWAKWSTVAFGALQIGIALASDRLGASQSVVDDVLAIASFTSGPMLGLYLLGVLSRVAEKSALIGFVAGLIAVCYARYGAGVWWPWYAVFGALTAYFVGCLVSPIIDKGKSLPSEFSEKIS